ncbi:hypothetical protein B7463_g7341, partial [Scytalidium lignicola]
MPTNTPSINYSPLDIPSSEISFVVTRFKEPLDPWVIVVNRTYLYDKFGTPQTDDAIQHSSFLEYSLAQNIGHEQQTICLHSYNHYDDLSNIVIFSQAAPFTNLLSPVVNTTLQMLELAATRPFDPAFAPALIFNWELIHDLDQWDRINWSSPAEDYWISASERKTLATAPYTMGEYWQWLFGKPHPSAVRVNHGGSFGTTRQAIQRHPKEFYSRCLEAFNSCGQNTSNAELGFFMERMDLAIIDEKFWLPHVYHP